MPLDDLGNHSIEFPSLSNYSGVFIGANYTHLNNYIEMQTPFGQIKIVFDDHSDFDPSHISCYVLVSKENSFVIVFSDRWIWR